MSPRGWPLAGLMWVLVLVSPPLREPLGPLLLLPSPLCWELQCSQTVRALVWGSLMERLQGQGQPQGTPPAWQVSLSFPLSYPKYQLSSSKNSFQSFKEHQRFPLSLYYTHTHLHFKCASKMMLSFMFTVLQIMSPFLSFICYTFPLLPTFLLQDHSFDINAHNFLPG